MLGVKLLWLMTTVVYMHVHVYTCTHIHVHVYTEDLLLFETEK